MGLNEERMAMTRCGHGHGGRAVRIAVAITLAMAGLMVGGIATRNAAAAITWSNAAGWQGNQVFYMSPLIYGTGTDLLGFGNYVLPEWNESSGAQTKDVVVVPNSVGVAVGARSTDFTRNLGLYESYDTFGGDLVVHVPIAVIGATYTNYSTDVECVYESLRNNYLSNVEMNIQWSDNFGINATGTLYPGTPPITKAQNDLMADAFWSAAEVLPGVGTVHTWADMYQTYLEAAKAVGSPNIEGFKSTSAAGQYVIQSYNVVNQTAWLHNSQSPTYDVFGSSMYVEVDINKTVFSTYPSSSTNYTFTVMGQNSVGFWGDGCTSGNPLGAWMPLNLFAYPAIEVEGTIYLTGTPLANQPLSLSDGGSNVYTFSTNSQGHYRFFAKPGTTYTLTTTYGTTQTTFTTGTDPSVQTAPQYVNLSFSYLQGTVKAAGKAVAGAVVNVGPPNASPVQTTTDVNGNYRFAIQVGTTYSVWAILSNAFGTATSTIVYVSAPGSATVWSNFTLSLSDVYGWVSCAGCPSTPMVVLQNSGGTQVATYPNANGYYTIWTATTGTYKVFAGVGYYSSSTYSVNVAATGRTYWQNLTLTKSSGGCVLMGTLITTPSGEKRVELLSQGDTVLGYNVTSGSWVKESVVTNTATSVNGVLSINDGLLVVTVTEQPLYVQNGTWTGWVRDPQNLSVGERVLDPSTGSWITLTSLQMLYGTYTVYDLRVTAPKDFVANGVLALDKIG